MSRTPIRHFLASLVHSKAKDEDIRRQEYILNILLLASVCLGVVASCISIIDFVENGFVPRTTSPLIVVAFTIFFCILYGISRFIQWRISASLFIFSLLSAGIFVSLGSGVLTSQAIFMYVLTIVVAAITMGSRFSFITTLIITIFFIVTAYLQGRGILELGKMIYKEGQSIYDMSDAIPASISLLILCIVSWISTSETEKALHRAKSSEKELKKERDLLEVKIEERTQELKRAQLEKMAQLYRFAEVGRLTSGLFHDLVNPLSIVSLNLDALNAKSKSLHLQEMPDIRPLLKRAIRGTHKLEEFIKTTRQQLQHQEVIKPFSVKHEIQHVVHMLRYTAKDLQVTVILNVSEDVKIIGNAIKFNQIMLNLIANALDSYSNFTTHKRQVVISIKKTKNHVRISVHDFGSGIAKVNLERLFEPFFTTKEAGKGLGIGLYITRDIIEKSFGGKIEVNSNNRTGTIFIVTLSIMSS